QMSNRTLNLDNRLYDYLLSVSLREAPVLRRLREETAMHPDALMQISPEQGQFMQLLVRLMGAKRCIEVGTFTGYSSLAVALALPDDGRILALDVSDEFTGIARRYWKDAGIDHKIELILAPATETLSSRLKQGEMGQYDFAFIDADKENYAAYYENCLQLVRPGGLVAIDNVLWSGLPADESIADSSTIAIRGINKKIHNDQRVHISLLPIGDGLTLAQKI
ncbi:MAG: class I SAM-dependent methyltransferase, partial [Kiloniellales bacterium]|nr:class I SAM-dependent methyltransferase [Kiloniellales bacterium]